MTALIIALAVISLTDVPYMLRKQQKKELAVFIVIAIITFGLGLLVVFHPDIRSISDMVLSLYDNIMGGGKNR